MGETNEPIYCHSGDPRSKWHTIKDRRQGRHTERTWVTTYCGLDFAPEVMTNIRLGADLCMRCPDLGRDRSEP